MAHIPVTNDTHYRLRAVLLICMVVLAGGKLYAQEAIKKINITVKEASLEEFSRKVELASGLSFVYGEEVKLNSTITLEMKDKTVDEILKKAFLNEPVEYRISGKHIILQKSKKKTAGRKYTVSGYVTDRMSAETLIGANVYESRQRQGTSTNPYGYYTLTLPEGETGISFSYLGYSTQTVSLTLRKDTLLNIRLNSDNVLEEVIVVSDRAEAGLHSTHTGAIDIPMAQVKNTPTILGEADVMKVIQLTPGVQAGVEGSAGLHIRGGGPDQNLILLDGVPIYNVDHLLGFFSVFTPEAVKKVTLFKGSFPARFGGRLSSVVDIRTNDGDMKSYHGSFSIGLLSTKVNIEGPIIQDRTAFSLAARRSYLDLVTKPFMDDDFRGGYYFYDINAKINHKFSDKNRLFLSIYQGNDYYDFDSKDNWGEDESTKDDINARWGNTVVAARWNSILSNKLFANTTVAYNRYKLNMNSKSYMRYKEMENAFHTNYNSGIRDWSAQVDFDYDPVPVHHIKFGASYLYHNFRPEVMSSRVSLKSEEELQDTIYKGISNERINAHELAVYAEDNFDVSRRLRVNAGFHLSAFHVQGKTYYSLQPRLSARYMLSESLILKGAYSKMSQYINLLTSAPISMPTDLWVPVTRNIRPMRAHQYSLGIYHTGIRGWEFSAEGYYKDMTNILEYKESTRYIGSSESWEKKVEMGKGHSFGIEFMARRTIGKTTGWAAYTLAKSDRKFAKGGINNGERFPFKYDRRHNLNVVVNHKFSEKTDIGISWYYATGGTTTIAREQVSIIRPDGDYGHTSESDYIESRNNYRLPASHRLNIGVNFHKKTKNGVRTWNFSLYNAYNAMNPTFIHRSEKIVSADNGEVEYEPVLKKFTLLPFLPSVSYTYRF